MCTKAFKVVLRLATSTIVLFLASCASIGMEEWNVHDKDNSTMGTSLPSLGKNGIIAIHINKSQKYASHFMRRNCESYGGLNDSSIVSLDGPKTGFGFYYYTYRCNGFQPRIPIDLPIKKAHEVDLKIFKEQCLELGFKSGTEGFGKCVLQLSK